VRFVLDGGTAQIELIAGNQNVTGVGPIRTPMRPGLAGSVKMFPSMIKVPTVLKIDIARIELATLLLGAAWN